MRDIFAIDRSEPDEFEGIDLLYGLPGDPQGESLAFFQSLARQKGVDAQQGYARLAVFPTLPYAVDSYAEQLVLKLHGLFPDRNSSAWQDAATEVEHCIGYMTILFETWVVPLPVELKGEGHETTAWEMRHLDKHHLLAGTLIPELVSYRAFCDDADYFGEKLHTRLEVLNMLNDTK